MKGRIWFAKNPWPKGHAIVRAVWSGRLEPSGELIFDFDIKSADYDADDKPDADEEDELDDDWKAKIVWTNYGGVSLSSTKWGHAGIWVGSAKKPLAWRKLDGSTIRADRATDTLPHEDESAALGIYLLGHDGVADHALRFTRTGKTWSIDWKAKIALAYTGNLELEHRMKLELRGIAFDGFAIPKGMSPKAARALFDASVTDPAEWTIAKRRFVRAK